MVIDLSRLGSEAPDGESPPVDFPALLELLKKYRLAPVAVYGGSAEQAAAALAAGLFTASDARDRHCGAQRVQWRGRCAGRGAACCAARRSAGLIVT